MELFNSSPGKSYELSPDYSLHHFIPHPLFPTPHPHNSHVKLPSNSHQFPLSQKTVSSSIALIESDKHAVLTPHQEIPIFKPHSIHNSPKSSESSRNPTIQGKSITLDINHLDQPSFHPIEEFAIKPTQEDNKTHKNYSYEDSDNFQKETLKELSSQNGLPSDHISDSSTNQPPEFPHLIIDKQSGEPKSTIKPNDKLLPFLPTIPTFKDQQLPITYITRINNTNTLLNQPDQTYYPNDFNNSDKVSTFSGNYYNLDKKSDSNAPQPAPLSNKQLITNSHDNNPNKIIQSDPLSFPNLNSNAHSQSHNYMNHIEKQDIENSSRNKSLNKRLEDLDRPKIYGNALEKQNPSSPLKQNQESHFSLLTISSIDNDLYNKTSSDNQSENNPLISTDINVSPNILQQTTNLSFFVNICLFATKVYISVSSGSMAIIACTVDSLMDILSGTLILITQRIILQKTISDKRYPAGRSLLEPVCTIVYATVMGSVSVQLCLFCIQQSFFPKLTPPYIDVSILFVLFFTVVIKLILWAFCLLISKRRGDHLFVLTNDHKSDVITNTLAFLLCIVLFFDNSLRVLDNIGALMIAGFASFTWIYSNRDQMHILSGYKADPQFYQFIAQTISKFPHIIVDDIKAYHFGVKYLVELYIVMDPNTSVRDYVRMEKLLREQIKNHSMVQQCFISIDYQRRFSPVSEQHNEARLQKRRAKGRIVD